MVDFKVDIKRDYRGVLQRLYFLDKSDGLRMGRYDSSTVSNMGQEWSGVVSAEV